MASFPGNLTLNSDDLLKNLDEALSVVKKHLVGLNDEQKQFLTPMLEKLIVKRNEFELEAPKATQRLTAMFEANKKKQADVMARIKAKISALAIKKKQMGEQKKDQDAEKERIANLSQKPFRKPSLKDKGLIPKEIKLLSPDELRELITKKIADTSSTPRTTGNIWDNWKGGTGSKSGNPEQGPKS